MKDVEKGINWIVKNWEKIPDSFKNNVQGIIEGTSVGENTIVFFLDRQKPSVEASWDFDEERIGVTKNGKIIWGFDSGCSCPSPWEDGAKCYSCVDTWKQFEVELSSFDKEVLEDCLKGIEEIRKEVQK